MILTRPFSSNGCAVDGVLVAWRLAAACHLCTFCHRIFSCVAAKVISGRMSGRFCRTSGQEPDAGDSVPCGFLSGFYHVLSGKSVRFFMLPGAVAGACFCGSMSVRCRTYPRLFLHWHGGKRVGFFAFLTVGLSGCKNVLLLPVRHLPQACQRTIFVFINFWGFCHIC